MTLFQRLKSDPLLHDTQSFVHLLLHRLSISEVIAASKFKKSITDEVGQEPNALKKIREKCKTLNYSEPHTDTIAFIYLTRINFRNNVATYPLTNVPRFIRGIQ